MTRRCLYRTRTRKGFSLLELLLAMLIIAISTTAVLAWTASLRQLSYVESLGASAMALCQFKLEQLLAVGYTDLVQDDYPAETKLTLDTRGTMDTGDDILASRSVKITEDTSGNVPIKHLRVLTSWTVGGQDYSEELETWVSVAG